MSMNPYNHVYMLNVLCSIPYIIINSFIDQSANSILMTSYIFLSVSVEFFMSINPRYVYIMIVFWLFLYVTMNILIDQSANSILMTSYIFLSISVEFFMFINPKYV